jgi:hypothetical protein
MFSFIETRLFTRLVQEYLNDDEYRELQKALMDNPETGNVIPGSGGVRKLRWRAPGRGKARWVSCDLLFQDLAGRDLDADNVSEERG